MDETQPSKSYAPTQPNRPPKRRRPTSWLQIIASILGGIVLFNLCLTIIFIAYYASVRTKAAEAKQTPPQPFEMLQTVVPLPNATATVKPPTGVVTILLLGTDARPNELNTPSRTDTMMIARIDFDRKTAKLLSIPRDVWVGIPNMVNYGVTEDRINSAYFYGEAFNLKGGGAKAAMDTVTLNFGIPIDHYALINFQGFVKSVDALGGIDIDVPTAIYDPFFPTDDYKTMIFSVKAGLQHMDGITALRYARTRHQDSDTERIKRQQLVLLAIRDKTLNVNAITRIPELYNAALGSYETDLSLSTLISYGIAGQKIERANIKTYAIDYSMLISWTTPQGGSVLIPDRARIAPVVKEFLGN